MNDIVVIDIETTGLDRLTSQIVNIGGKHVQSGEEFYVECYPDLEKPYEFHPIAAKINGTDPEDFKERDDRDYVSQQFGVENLINWVKNVTKGEAFCIAGQNIASFDMMVLCRTLNGNFDMEWDLGHRFLDISSLSFALTGEILGSKQIAKELGIEPECKIHTGLSGARHETEVLQELLSQLGF